MSAVKERIIDKLKYLETFSDSVLQEVLDFVYYLEWKLSTNKAISQNTNTHEVSTISHEEDTGTFLLSLSTSFLTNLSEETLENLPSDGAENHDRYLF